MPTVAASGVRDDGEGDAPREDDGDGPPRGDGSGELEREAAARPVVISTPLRLLTLPAMAESASIACLHPRLASTCSSSTLSQLLNNSLSQLLNNFTT